LREGRSEIAEGYARDLTSFPNLNFVSVTQAIVIAAARLAKTKPANNREKHSIQIIIVGVPKVVRHVIYALHCLSFAKAGDWIEVKRNKATDELTMTITLNFML